MANIPTEEDLRAWVRLACEEALGAAQALQLAGQFGGARQLYAQPLARLRAAVAHPLAVQLAGAPSGTVARRIDDTLSWAARPGRTLLFPAHPDYPAPLRQTPGHPLLLYAQGNVGRLRHEAIAIVGARNATSDGLDNAHAFAKHLARRGFCIVSGLALGIDAAAHRGALDAGAAGAGTIAVLGTGADITYPAVNTSLAQRILEQDGLLLTDLPLGSPPRAGHFPRRNRIVAGLSRGVLVVEAALRSGSLITARLATDMGREVFAIPGSIHAPLSRGPHALIQQGAKLVEQECDILGELAPIARTDAQTGAGAVSPTPECAIPAQPLSPLWPAIGYDPVTEDTLQRRCGLLPAILQAELLTLELSGHIRRNADGRVLRARRGR